MRPLIFTDDEIEQISISEIILTKKIPLKTYKLDFENGRVLSKFVDDEEAIKQSIYKTLKTAREKYLIYSSNFGSELNYLYGKQYSQEYLELEIPRLINEALMVYDWFESTEDYTIEKNGEVLYISFAVSTNMTENFAVEVTI